MWILKSHNSLWSCQLQGSAGYWNKSVLEIKFLSFGIWTKNCLQWPTFCHFQFVISEFQKVSICPYTKLHNPILSFVATIMLKHRRQWHQRLKNCKSEIFFQFYEAVNMKINQTSEVYILITKLVLYSYFGILG